MISAEVLAAASPNTAPTVSINVISNQLFALALPHSKPKRGLSHDAQIGLGVGLGVGGFLLLLLLAGLCLCCLRGRGKARRRNKKERELSPAASTMVDTESPPPVAAKSVSPLSAGEKPHGVAAGSNADLPTATSTDDILPASQAPSRLNHQITPHRPAASGRWLPGSQRTSRDP